LIDDSRIVRGTRLRSRAWPNLWSRVEERRAQGSTGIGGEVESTTDFWIFGSTVVLRARQRMREQGAAVADLGLEQNESRV
jgi:hypothetical protein